MSKKKHRDETVTAMKRLNTYSPEYDRVIDVYADLLDVYDRTMLQFKACGYEAATDTESGGQKANPIGKALLDLSKEILVYSDRLGLNPKTNNSLKQASAEKSAKKNSLAEVLQLMRDG